MKVVSLFKECKDRRHTDFENVMTGCTNDWRSRKFTLEDLMSTDETPAMAGLDAFTV